MRERRWLAENVANDICVDLDHHMREFICDSIYNSILQTEERCKIFFEGRIEEKRNLKEMKEHHGHIEDYLHQSFRQRNIELCNEISESDQDTTTERHVIAIRRNSTSLLENLNLEGTLLLDRLMERDVLSDAGRKSILSRKTQTAQNIAFLDHVTKTFNEAAFRTIFLPALKKDHEGLSYELQKDLDLSHASFPVVRRCTPCEVKSRISIRKFAKCLHQAGLIDEALCSELVVSDRSQTDRWNLIVQKVRKNGKAAMMVLMKLNLTLYQTLKRTNSSLFICTCDELDTIKSDVTVTGDNKTGEPDVARLSDFSSVSSLSSPTTVDTDKGRQDDSEIMRAPLPPTGRDRRFSSPRMSPVSSYEWREKISRFECLTCTHDVLYFEEAYSVKSKELTILKHRLDKRNRMHMRRHLASTKNREIIPRRIKTKS